MQRCNFVEVLFEIKAIIQIKVYCNFSFRSMNNRDIWYDSEKGQDKVLFFINYPIFLSFQCKSFNTIAYYSWIQITYPGLYFYFQLEHDVLVRLYENQMLELERTRRINENLHQKIFNLNDNVDQSIESQPCKNGPLPLSETQLIQLNEISPCKRRDYTFVKLLFLFQYDDDEASVQNLRISTIDPKLLMFVKKMFVQRLQQQHLTPDVYKERYERFNYIVSHVIALIKNKRKWNEKIMCVRCIYQQNVYS